MARGLLTEEVVKVYRQFFGEKGLKKKMHQFKGGITLDSISKVLANLKIARDLLTGK
jgi:hypothetical protein